MKNIMKKIFMCVLIISLFMNNYIYGADTGDKDDEVVRTIDSINKLREIYNLPLLSFDDALNKTAKIHNRYMDFNNSYSSIEESGKLYYRGRYPWDRASYNGYTKSYVFEALIKDITTFESGLAQLIQNPYARYSILDPLYSELGMSSYNEYTTYLFGGSNRNNYYEVAYPYKNQKNVDTTFTNKYIINPYGKLSDAPEKVGIPITYNIYSSEGKILEFSNINVRLLDTRNNRYLDVKVYNSNEDRNLTNSIMILPMEEYNYGTTYEISIKADLQFDKQINFGNGRKSHTTSIDYKGTFTTKESTIEEASYSFITRAQFVEDLMKTSNFIIRDSLEIIFPDVNINAQNYKYIFTAFSNNIIKGYGDGLFRPDANISREQAYTILMRTYEEMYGKILLEDKDNSLDFSDKTRISSYALDALYKAKKIGLLIDNKYEFNPSVYISTREFKEILNKYEKIVKTSN